MKKILLMCCLMAVATGAVAQEVSVTYWQTLKNGTLVNKCMRSRTVTRNGQIVSLQTWYDNGRPERSETYDSEGRPHGESLLYDELGRVLFKTMFDHGREARTERYDVVDGKYMCVFKERRVFDGDDEEGRVVERWELVGRKDRDSGRDGRTLGQTAGVVGDCAWSVDPVFGTYTERSATGSAVYTDRSKQYLLESETAENGGRRHVVTFTKMASDGSWEVDDRVRKSVFKSDSVECSVEYDLQGAVVAADTVHVDSLGRRFVIKSADGHRVRVYGGYEKRYATDYHAVTDLEGNVLLVVARADFDKADRDARRKPVESLFGSPCNNLVAKYAVNLRDTCDPYRNLLLGIPPDINVLREGIVVCEDANRPSLPHVDGKVAAMMYHFVEDVAADNALLVDDGAADALKLVDSLINACHVERREKVVDEKRTNMFNGQVSYEKVTKYYYVSNLSEVLPAWLNGRSTCLKIEDNGSAVYYDCRQLSELTDDTADADIGYVECVARYCASAEFAEYLRSAVEAHEQFVRNSRNKKLIRQLDNRLYRRRNSDL